MHFSNMRSYCTCASHCQVLGYRVAGGAGTGHEGGCGGGRPASKGEWLGAPGMCLRRHSGTLCGMSTKELVLRYPGVCAACTTALAPGVRALRDSSSRLIWCLPCSERDTSAASSSAAAVSPSPPPSPEAPVSTTPAPPPLVSVVPPLDVTASPTESSTEPLSPAPAASVAGASAKEEYRRRQTRYRQRVRDRFGFLAPLVLTLFGEPQHVRAWVRGAKGERVVGLLLDEIVAQEPGACVLHDRRFKGSRANLDHIMVCRGGVFVVDAKNYRGRIEVRGRWSGSPSLWVGGRRATKLTEGVERQAEGVQRLLEAASVPVEVQPVLFFVDGNWSSGALRRRVGRVQLLGSRRSLRKHLSRSSALGPEAVAAVMRRLEDELVAAV